MNKTVVEALDISVSAEKRSIHICNGGGDVCPIGELEVRSKQSQKLDSPRFRFSKYFVEFQLLMRLFCIDHIHKRTSQINIQFFERLWPP